MVFPLSQSPKQNVCDGSNMFQSGESYRGCQYLGSINSQLSFEVVSLIWHPICSLREYKRQDGKSSPASVAVFFILDVRQPWG